MTFSFPLPRRDRTKKLRTKIRNFHEEAVRRSFNKLNPFRDRIKMVFSSSNRHKQQLAQLEQFQQLEYHNPHLIAYHPHYNYQANADGSYGGGRYQVYEKGDDTGSESESSSEDGDEEDERETMKRSDRRCSMDSEHTGSSSRPGSQELPPPYPIQTIELSEPNRLVAPITEISEKRRSLYESIYNSSCESFFSVASSFQSLHDSDDEDDNYFSCDEDEGMEKVKPYFAVPDPMDVEVDMGTKADTDVDMNAQAEVKKPWKPLGHMKSRSSGHFKPAGRFSFRFESLDDPVDMETEQN
jgi:hypothetical protein